MSASSSSHFPFSCLISWWEHKGYRSPLLVSSFWTLSGWSLFRSSLTHAPFGPERGSGIMQSLPLQFSWPTNVESSLDSETRSLALLISWQNACFVVWMSETEMWRGLHRHVACTHKCLAWVFAGSFSYFLKGPFNWGELLPCAWNSFVIVSFPLPSPPVLLFFPNCVCVCAGTRWVERRLEWWLRKLSEDFSQLKIQSSSFWCRLAENCEMVLHDKEEPWVCSVSCAHVLESPQLINSNYF